MFGNPAVREKWVVAKAAGAAEGSSRCRGEGTAAVVWHVEPSPCALGVKGMPRAPAVVGVAWHQPVLMGHFQGLMLGFKCSERLVCLPLSLSHHCYLLLLQWLLCLPCWFLSSSVF